MHDHFVYVEYIHLGYFLTYKTSASRNQNRQDISIKKELGA